MADVKEAVWLRWKAGLYAPTESSAPIVGDDLLANEVWTGYWLCRSHRLRLDAHGDRPTHVLTQDIGEGQLMHNDQTLGGPRQSYIQLAQPVTLGDDRGRVHHDDTVELEPLCRKWSERLVETDDADGAGLRLFGRYDSGQVGGH